MTNQDLAKRLEALLAKVTPGPWQQSYFVDHPRYKNMGLAWKEACRQTESEVIRGPGIVGNGNCNPVAVFKGADDDRALVIVLVNNARAIIDSLRGAEPGDFVTPLQSTHQISDAEVLGEFRKCGVVWGDTNTFLCDARIIMSKAIAADRKSRGEIIAASRAPKEGSHG